MTPSRCWLIDEIVRKGKRDKILWNCLHFCLKCVVITQSASHVTQQEIVGHWRKYTVHLCERCPSVLVLHVSSLRQRWLGGNLWLSRHFNSALYSQKTTLPCSVFFKGCHYSLLLRYGLKVAVVTYGINYTFTFLIKLVLLGASVSAFHDMTPHWYCNETLVSHIWSGLTHREGWAVHRHLSVRVNNTGELRPQSDV